MVEINQSAVAEFMAVVVTSVMYIVMDPHRDAFGLGYVPGVAVMAGPAFVQTLLELALELGVDNVAMWSEAIHGIAVTRYFAEGGLHVMLFQGLWCGIATSCGLFSVIRHPIL